MENREDAKQNTPIDPRLDVPAEANREKHINFLEVEEESANRSGSDNVDDFASERRKEWERGLAEGKEAREKGE
jgi:hypothetical protein